jgi:hypothetical protein
MSKLKVRGEFITWTGKVTDRSCKIELDITEEDIREAIYIFTDRYDQMDSIFNNVISLLTEEKPNANEVLKSANLADKGTGEEKKEYQNPHDTVYYGKQEEQPERSCSTCVNSPVCSWQSVCQDADYIHWHPKEKKEEEPDWEGLKTKEEVSMQIKDIKKSLELLREIRRHNHLVDIVRSLYEKVEGEK